MSSRHRERITRALRCPSLARCFAAAASLLYANHTTLAQTSANEEGWCAPAPSGGQVGATDSVTQNDIFTVLANNCVSLHQALTGAGASQGASFSYQSQSGKTETFQSSFALSYTPPLIPSFYVGPAGGELFGFGTVDGNLSTRSNAKNTFLNFRPQVGALFHSNLADPYHPSNPANDFFILSRFGPVFEASQDFSVQNAMGEVNITGRRDNLAMGSYKPIANSQTLFGAWIPYLDLEAGNNWKGRSTTYELAQTRLRIIPQVALLFSYTGGIAQALHLQNIALNLDETLSILPLESRSEVVNKTVVHSKVLQNFTSANLQFNINDNFSFGVSYSTGATAPFFKYADTFLVTLKLGFGAPVPVLLPAPKAAAK